MFSVFPPAFGKSIINTWVYGVSTRKALGPNTYYSSYNAMLKFLSCHNRSLALLLEGSVSISQLWTSWRNELFKCVSSRDCPLERAFNFLLWRRSKVYIEFHFNTDQYGVDVEENGRKQKKRIKTKDTDEKATYFSRLVLCRQYVMRWMAGQQYRFYII